MVDYVESDIYDLLSVCCDSAMFSSHFRTRTTDHNYNTSRARSDDADLERDATCPAIGGRSRRQTSGFLGVSFHEGGSYATSRVILQFPSSYYGSFWC